MNTTFKNFLLLSTFALFAVYAKKESSKNIQDTSKAFSYFSDELAFTLSPKGLKDVCEKKVEGIIVDIRRKDDFEKEHVPGAINIAFDQYDNFEGTQKDFSALSKTKMNYLYCYDALCPLALRAAKKFTSLGYPVKVLKGGFDAWKKYKYPIEAPKKCA